MKITRLKYFFVILGLLTLVALAVIAGRFWYLNAKPQGKIARLVKIVGANRITEARLSGGFVYAPFTPLPKLEKKKRPDFSNDPSFNLLSNNSNNSTVLSSEDPSNPDSNAETVQTADNKPLSTSRGASGKTYLNNLLLLSDLSTSSSYFSLFTEQASTRGATERAGEVFSSTSRSKVAETTDFKDLAAEIIFADIKQPTIETAHALGIVYIFLGDFNEAINSLEIALAKSPNNAEILNDLGVVYLARAEDEDQPADIFEALSFIDSAITADPTLIEAKYNLALILQKLTLSSQARKFWSEYLTKDKSADWVKEVNSYIDKLNEPTLTALWEREKNKVAIAANKNDYQTVKHLVTEFPHFARMYALDELIPAWATAYLKGDFDQANQALQTAQAIGKVLIEIHQDHMIDDGVATINRLAQQPDATKDLTNLAQAHLFYQEGRKLDGSNDFEKASKPLTQALNIFYQYKDNAFIALIYLNQTRSYFYSLENTTAFDKLEQTRLLSEIYIYPYLLGRVWSVNGQEQRKLFQFTKALQAMPLAVKYLKQTATLSDLAIAHVNYSQLLSELDDSKQVLGHYKQALETISQLEKSPLQNTITIGTTASYLTKIDKVKLVFYFYDEMLDMAIKNKIEDKIFFTTLRWRSYAYHRLNKDDFALQDIKQIRAYLVQFSDETFRLRAENELAIAEGEYILKKEPEKSIQLFTQIINTYLKAKGQQERIAYLYLLRARAYLVLNDYKNAENDLKASIQEFEIARSNIKYEGFRTNFFEKPQEIYDEMIQLQLKLNHNDIAFDYSEARKARSLLDLLSNNRSREIELFNDPQFILNSTPQPLSILKIQEKLPSTIVLINYAFIDEKLYIWCITKNEIHTIQSPLKENEINLLISEFYSSIKNNGKTEKFTPTLSKLYQAVFNPISHFISQQKTLVFIPNKSLNQIPFAALVDPNTNKYLIEKQKIVVVPSATVFIKCLERNQQLAKEKSLNTLIIGNPKFDKKDFSNLSYLPGAKLEANQISESYPNHQLLLEEQATKTNFLTLANNYDVIHFAGHAIMDAKFPLYSQLIFAKDSKQPNSSLYAYELYKQKFNHTKLVVLAACKTANGQNLNNEGVANLARPFLAAGVPTVIASLWDANDRASAKLFIAFHKNLATTVDPVEALQNAQLQLINNSDPSLRSPQMWAAFALLGGVSNQSK